MGAIKLPLAGKYAIVLLIYPTLLSRNTRYNTAICIRWAMPIANILVPFQGYLVGIKIKSRPYDATIVPVIKKWTI